MYDVYIFLEDPYNGTTNPPPISHLFDGSGLLFNQPINYLPHPNIESLQDTKHGIHCGRQNCDGCDETFKMKAVSSDYLLFKKVLESRSPTSTDGVIIVKPTTVAIGGTSASDVSGILGDAEEEAGGELDIFYFAKWLDRPEKYTTLRNYETGGKLIRTYSPHGLQAYALTAKGIDKLVTRFDPTENPVICRPFSQVIHMLVENCTLFAVSTTPLLMFYDATRIVLKTKKSALGEKARFSYLKTCEAQGEIHPEEPLNRRISADLSFFWLMVIMLVILITIAVFYCRNPGLCKI